MHSTLFGVTMDSDPSRPWLLASAEIVTVGLPFCVFKLMTGLVLAGLGFGSSALGYVLVALALVDASFNLANLTFFVVLRRRAVDVCSFDFLARLLSRRGARERQTDLGLAADVFLSFALVALMVGANMIGKMPSWALPVWNVAVVLNVLGAGIGRLMTALHRHSARTSRLS